MYVLADFFSFFVFACLFLKLGFFRQRLTGHEIIAINNGAVELMGFAVRRWLHNFAVGQIMLRVDKRRAFRVNSPCHGHVTTEQNGNCSIILN